MSRTCIPVEWVCALVSICCVLNSVTAADRGYGAQFGGQDNARGCTGQCTYEGTTYRGGEKFSYTKGCIKYNCECQCNGWYDCPRENNEDICRNRNTDRTGLSSSRGCRECNVHGVLFPSNAPFNYNRGCTELSQCHCHCDGSWNCTQGRDICRNTRITQLSSRDSSYSSSYSGGGSASGSGGGSSYSSGSSGTSRSGASGYSSGSSGSASSSSVSGGSSSGSSSGRRGGGAGSSFGSSDSRCKQCYVTDSRVENPNTYFKYRNGCAEWDSCFCNCEGYWNCDASTYKKVCEQGGGGGIDLNGGSCTPCDVFGKIQLGNTDFVHRNGCHEWTNCHCSCGGAFSCSDSSYRWACDNICRECNVDGRKYPGNTEFTHTKDCITYDPCQCLCNGSWSCPPEAGKWTCTDRCRECEVDGNRYRGNTEFRHSEGCWEWDKCQCRCNGSWMCPKEHARWTCSQQCRDCVLNDQTYPANSPFTFERGDCYRFHCQCSCNGSYDCPAEKTENTCLIDSNTGCYPCDVHGKSYSGQSVFNHTDGCMQYQDCVCNCNGFWECPGSKAVDTCHPNTPGSCYQCDVNGNKVAGGTHFSIEDGEWRFDCECYCSGNWHCAAEATYTGGSSHQLTGQCRDCYFLGRRHTSRTTFDSQWGCIKYNCQCNCDGQVECPVEQAQSVCSLNNHYFQEFQLKSLSSVPSSYCSSCKINDHFFPGNSQFEYIDGCHRHMLRCYCNSGYRVAKKIIDSCVDGILSGTIKYSKTSAVFLSVSRQCDRRCIVNGVEHAPRSSFEITLGCSTYRCRCACTGLPECQAPVDTSCNLQIHVISSSRISGGSSSSSLVSGGNARTVVGGGSHSSGRVISGGSQSGGSIVTGGSRRVITERTHSSGGGVVGGGTHSSSTRVVTGGSRVVNGGSRVVNGGSRVVTGGSRVVSGGSRVVTSGSRVVNGGSTVVSGGGGSSRVIERRIVSTGGGGGHSVVGGGSTSVVVSAGGSSNNCHYCVVEGKRYHGMAVFDYKRGCVRYRCQCDCRGYAICRAVSINECLASAQQCKPCYVENKRHEPNSRFTYDKDCLRTSCRCECDGMATCVRTEIPGCTHHDGCKQCVYNGVTREPNTQFHIDRTCERTVCQCDCTGHVTCSSPVRTCAAPETCGGCTVQGHYRPAKSEFTLTQGDWRMPCTCQCDNHYTCDRAKAEYIGDEPDDSHSHQTCRSCSVDGKVHPTKSKFFREQGCIRYRCQCFCDGNHECVSTGTNICSRPTTPAPVVNPHRHCKPCRVGSKEYPSEQTFNIDRSCKRYNCECYCSGRYGCRDSRENICHNHPNPTTPAPRPQPTCTKCHVQGKDYSPNTKFTIVNDECHVLHCKCSCDGSHNCDQEVTNVCRDRPNQCSTCTHDGTTHRHGERYKRVENCVEYDCECQCNGSPRCSATRRVCDVTPQCRPCRAPNGQQYQPNTQFVYDKDCHRYTCECACNGNYTCPPENTRRICPEPTTAPPVCRQCTDPNGRRHRANRRFTYDKDCHRFTCHCACDGNYNCPSEHTRKICTEGGGHGQCTPCTDPTGRQHRAGPFLYDKDCHRYTCTCNCNGHYDCPPDQAVNFCNRGQGGSSHHSSSSGGSTTHVSGSHGSGSSVTTGHTHIGGSTTSYLYRYGYSTSHRYGDTGCFYCVAGGANRTPNAAFLFDDDCYRFSCMCACNGSWECPASQTQEICKTHTHSQGSSGSSNSHGGSVSSGSHTHTSGSSTSYRYGYSTSHRYGDTGCFYCVAGGANRNPNERFQFDDDCYRFSCVCSCNGSWECPASQTQEICKTHTNSQGSSGSSITHVHSGGSSSSSGSVHSSSSAGSSGLAQSGGSSSSYRYGYSTSHRYGNTGCFYCVAGGANRAPNERFQFDDDCYRFSCVCACNGSWECPASQTQEICKTHTNSQGSSGSSITQVHSGGSSSSSGSIHSSSSAGSSGLTQNGGSSSSYRYGYSTSHRYGNTGCFYCVAGGANRAPNERFQFDDDCYRFSCVCACNGSWECPASQTQEICKTHTNSQGSSGSSITQVHSGGSSSSSGSIHSSSSAGSSGLTQNGGSSSSYRYGYSTSHRYGNTGCFYCVAGGANRAPNERFQFDDDCYRFSCVCACNGSWECPASQTQEICQTHGNSHGSSGSSGQGGTCRQCTADGNNYAGNSHFQYDRDCFRFNCDCYCNGSWNCPAERTENLCTPERGHCRKCNVQGYDREPNSRFQFDKNCFRYDCDCYCNGSYNCPAERTREIPGCGSHRSRQGTEPCKNCMVNEESHEPYSDFSYTEGCLKHKCHCHCNGTYSCPAENAENICPEGKNCTDCVLKGNSYRAGAKFQYIEGCAQYDCDCFCDGSFHCPPSRTVDVCRDKPNPCTQCEYGGMKYPGNAKFVVKEKCSQVECFCDCQGKITCKGAINTCADRGDLG